MAWQKIPGLAGKLYTPDPIPAGKQKRCLDCFACQRCSHERCAVCGPATPGLPPEPQSSASQSPKEAIP